MTNKSSSHNRILRIAYLAIMASVAFVLSFIETMIPIPAPAPGIKLGLANVVALILLLDYKNPLYAILVTILRCLLATLAFGSLSTLFFSLAGGLFSCIIMWFLLRLNIPISTIGISLAGALTHNVSQLAAASLTARDTAVFSYLPILITAGAAAGAVTGYVGSRVHVIIKSINIKP